MKKAVLALCLILVLLIQPVKSAEIKDTEDDFDVASNMLDSLDISKTVDDSGAKQFLRELGIERPSIASLLRLTPGQFLVYLLELLKDYYKMPARFFICMLGLIIVISVFGGVSSGSFLTGGIQNSFNTAVTLVAATMTMSSVHELTLKLSLLVTSAQGFLASFIPIFVGAIGAGGQPVFASVYSAVLFTAVQVVTFIFTRVLMPFLSLYMVISVVGALSEELSFLSMAKTVKSFVSWTLGLTVTVFVGILTLQGFLSSSADSLTIKTGKFLIGSFVPVVGSALSDALASVYGGIKVVKSAVGFYGIAAFIGIVLPLIVQSALWMFALSMSAAAADSFGVKPAKTLLSACSDMVSLMMTMILCLTVLIIISISIALTLAYF